MNLNEVKTIGVAGTGLMGNGIAQVVAAADFPVVLYDISMDAAKNGLGALEKRVKKDVEKGKRSGEEADALLARLTLTDDVNALSDVDFLFEVVFERMDIKRDFYRKVDAVCKPSCIFASNTSSLSVTEMASITKRADRFIGTHFFNPVPVMKLVEVVKGYDTSEDSYRLTMDLLEKIGKETITVNEAPLFCVNRILIPMLTEAMFVLQEGIATKEDIDKGMVLGANHPIGPLALIDLIGLDILLMVMENLYLETRDSKYRPCPLMVKMVRAGHYGRKSGRGFYTYE